MKILRREKMRGINVQEGDRVQLLCDNRVILEEIIKRKMDITEVVIFDVEPNDFEGVTDGIGGAFLEGGDDGTKRKAG